MSLYTKILLFFITLVVLLSVVTTYSGIRSIERIAVNELEKGLASDIDLFSFSVDSEFYHMENRMRFVAMRRPLRDAIRRRDIGRIREIFTDLLQRESIDVLHLVDDRNTPIVTLRSRRTDLPVTLPLPASGATTRGFTTIDTRDGVRPALFLSIPLEEPKVVLSELVILDNANPLVRNLSDLLSRKRGEPVYVSLFKDDRRMFSTIFSLTGTATQDLPEEITTALQGGRENYIGRTTIGRSGYYTVYKPSPYNEAGSPVWSYGIAVSEDIFMPFKKRLLFVFVMISVLATSAVIIITFAITRGIDPSLRGILDICAKIEDGNTLSRIDSKRVTTREFTQIASSINRMLDSISEREKTISDNMDRIRAINAELEEKTNIIRQDRMRFLSILETVDEGVVALDHEGVIIYYNRAAAAITGTDPEAALGDTWKSLFPSLDISGEDHAALQELTIPREDSSEPLYLRVLASPWSVENAPQGRILVLQDISREKRMEEFKADFVSSINHDIRSFLVPVSGFIGRILEGKYGPLEDAVRERLLNVADNVSKVHHLVENYLNVSRIESGKLDLAIGPVDMNEVIRDVAKLYAPRVIFADGATPQALVLADKDYIERVITNLVVNALKFSPEDSTVRIGTRVEGGMLVTFVEDRGAGIPARELRFIFEKYRRGSLGRREEGSGLGLFIVKSVVEGHGGSIWVDSVPGRGSTFFFSLPLSRGEI
ncbi:MAG TPA: ATP-binding protein [Syntrophorhabdaceae bacterium]|nr:ATP-binding protein [Syntrophorhabdaceae bacterium]